MPKAFWKSTLLLILFASCVTSPCAFALNKNAKKITLEAVSRLIRERRGSWIALKGSLAIEFHTSEGKAIACRGELVYQRLDEKILLRGFDAKNELLFAFKTFDRNFELYLPLISEYYEGSIFDLEDSPDIHSHLRALDLYRAFKPGIVSGARTELHPEKSNSWRIVIHRQSRETESPARELLVSETGDVLQEIFYSDTGTKTAEILRSGFKGIKRGSSSRMIFPHRIEITAYSSAKSDVFSQKTVLNFQQIELLPSVDDQDFLFSIPEKTRKINLEN